MKKILIKTISIILFLLSSSVLSAEFAISPMMLEFDEAPGAKTQFEFQIHGKKAGTAKISFSDLSQEATGHMAFYPVEANKKSLRDWITISDTSVQVKEGETRTITGTVEVPRSAKGNHVVAIMIEEDKPQKDTGISLNVRYAIIVSLNVSGRKQRLRNQFSDLQIEEQDGRNFVSAWFTNLSDRDSYLDSRIQLRDGNRKLVAKIPLKTQSAWKRGDISSRVFPGAKVKVYGLLEESIKGGEYTLMARNRFGGRSQPMVSKKVVLVSSIHEASGEEITADKNLEVSPNPVAIKVNPKGQSFSVIRLRNPHSYSVRLELPESSSEGSVEYRFTPNFLELPPKGSGVVTLRQVFKRQELKPTTYAVKILGGEKDEFVTIKTQL